MSRFCHNFIRDKFISQNIHEKGTGCKCLWFVLHWDFYVHGVRLPNLAIPSQGKCCKLINGKIIRRNFPTEKSGLCKKYLPHIHYLLTYLESQ